MNRITTRLKELGSDHKKAVVAYIVNGDPRPSTTLSTMHSLVEKGTDIIELGVPFSDPMAEGPVIARGHERALAYHVSLKDCIETVREFRKTNQHTPVILMGYANPIERMGYDAFVEQATSAGVDGVLIVDLPPEESGVLNQKLSKANMSMIFLVAPTTSEERMRKIASEATGFIYYVSLRGVTGAGHLDIDEVQRKLESMREITSLPICVGFGIKDAASAKAISRFADGVVVGSALVKMMGEMENAEDTIIANMVGGLIEEIASGVHTSSEEKI